MPEPKARRYLPALAAFCACIVAGSSSPPPLAASQASDRALARYHAAMTEFKSPPNMVFTYAETRSGPQRIVTGTHHVYRDSAGYQRNDTIEVNGSPVRPPITHTYQQTTWPYSAEEFDAPAADYDLTLKGMVTINGRHAYSFDAKKRAAAEFAITELDIDTAANLPLRERFSVSTSQCQGTGSIEFSPVGTYWLPSSVAVECGPFKNAIRFSDYSFPAAIPQDVLHPAAAS